VSRFSGNTQMLRIDEVDFRESNIHLRSSALIYNVDDTKNLRIDLSLREFSTTRTDLLALLPGGTVPDSALHYIPASMKLRGMLKGSMDHLVTDLTMISSSGNIRVKGSLDHAADKLKAFYNLDIEASQMDLKTILKDSSFRSFGGRVKVNGRGFDPETAVATIDATVDGFSYKGYDYHALKLDAVLDHGFLKANFDARDSNLNGSGHVEGRFTGPEKSLLADINFVQLNLKDLGLVEDSISWAGSIKADIPVFSDGRIDGNIIVIASDLRMGNRRLAMDTISVLAKHNADSQYLSLQAPFLSADLSGRYNLADLPSTVEQILNRYVKMNSADTAFNKNVEATLVVRANIPDSVSQLVGGLKTISPFNVAGSINTSKNQVLFAGNLERLQYGSYLVDSVGMFAMTSLDQDNPGLKAGLYIQSLLGPGFTLNGAFLDARAFNGVFDLQLRLEDEKHQPRYVVPVSYVNDPKRPFVQLRDSLLINKKRWQVNKDNRIYTDMKSLAGSNLSISNGPSSLEIRTSADIQSGLPAELYIKDLELSDIADILIADSSLVSGKLGARVSLSSFSPISFNANVKADSLEVMGLKLGTFAANVVNPDSTRMVAEAALLGPGAALKLKGELNTREESVDVQLDLATLELGMAAPFIEKYLANPGGTLHGSLRVRGNQRNLDLQGDIGGKELAGIYTMTGTYLKIPVLNLKLGEKDIRLENATLLDSMGNKAELNAILELLNNGNFKLGMSVRGENFEVVGRRRNQEQKIFGPARASFNLKMNGVFPDLLTDGKINLSDGSELTYVYSSGENDQLGEGLVEFFNPLEVVDSTAEKKLPVKTGMNMDVNLYLGVTPKSTITIITDETSGDQLKAKGKADLNFLMKPGGSPELLGNYVLDGGEYDITLAGLVKKSFRIENGSSISWSGDIKKGTADITAKYETKASAGPLLNDVTHMPGIDKQKLKFDVLILLKKELLKPDIGFKLDMPSSDQQAFDGLVYSRIKQVNTIPAELNKQVMGLLAFGQFIAENPFNSLTSAGGDFQTQAFNTVGKLLTQELTNMVGRYVKGVDIDLGVEMGSDYTTGKEIRKTDLKLGLSKSFANNRLNVYVGSNFALEGSNQQRDALNGLAGDVTMEYLLTPDGKFRLKGYRLTDNSMAFQGNMVRTGASFVVVLEFNRFKNMFGRKKSKKIS
jgi:hypothetical protein